MSDCVGNSFQRTKFPNFLEEWLKINNGDFTPLDYLNQAEGPEFTIAAAWLFVPDFVEYRGGVFRTQLPRGLTATSRETIDDWFTYLKGDVSSVERLCNQFTVTDAFTACDLTPYEDDLDQFVYSLTKSWASLLKVEFPKVEFCFEISENDAVGRQITFFQKESNN